MRFGGMVRAIFPHAMMWGTVGLALTLPDLQAQYITTKMPLLAVMVGWSILLAILLGIAVTKKVKKLLPERVLRGYDICSLFSFIIFGWELSTNKVPILDPFVFVCPARVFNVFVYDYPILLGAIWSSMNLLLWGFFIGITSAIILGLIAGWFKPVFNIAYPFAKIVAPIPPPVYIPFLIIVFPLMTQTAITIIFLGAFWPTFAATCFAAYAIDRRYIEAAQMLGAKSSWSLIRRVVYPAIKPQIFAGVFIGLILAFILLIVAEMVGASSGLGFYILTQRQLVHYPEVIAGILTTGLVVVLWAAVFDMIQARSLRWQAA